MFSHIQPAPPDPILGLTEAFLADPRPHKINLGVGVYKDEAGATPILASVKAAEERLLREERSKSYLPIDGSPDYGRLVQELVLGAAHAAVQEQRVATSHTPGGTGALRVVGDFVRAHSPTSTVWLSAPTWANHPAIFEAAGLPTRTYRYFHTGESRLDEEGMLADLQQVKPQDLVLLHGCCHNPTGVDPTSEQWRRVGALLAQRGAVPLLDFAYQGFATGVDEDRVGLLAILEQCPEAFVCSSFSKNFGLYRERVGALTIVARSAPAAAAVQSNIKVCIRRNYSNPAAHGGEVVRVVLTEPTLREQWQQELRAMRERIANMRQALRAGLDRRGVQLNPRGNQFIIEQKGMFSFSGLTRQQVERLREEHAVYVVGSGRINVAGITPGNLDALCSAIAAVAGH